MSKVINTTKFGKDHLVHEYVNGDVVLFNKKKNEYVAKFNRFSQISTCYGGMETVSIRRFFVKYGGTPRPKIPLMSLQELKAFLQIPENWAWHNPIIGRYIQDSTPTRKMTMSKSWELFQSHPGLKNFDAEFLGDAIVVYLCSDSLSLPVAIHQFDPDDLAERLEVCDKNYLELEEIDCKNEIKLNNDLIQLMDKLVNKLTPHTEANVELDYSSHGIIIYRTDVSTPKGIFIPVGTVNENELNLKLDSIGVKHV